MSCINTPHLSPISHWTLRSNTYIHTKMHTHAHFACRSKRTSTHSFKSVQTSHLRTPPPPPTHTYHMPHLYTLTHLCLCFSGSRGRGACKLRRSVSLHACRFLLLCGLHAMVARTVHHEHTTHDPTGHAMHMCNSSTHIRKVHITGSTHTS